MMFVDEVVERIHRVEELRGWEGSSIIRGGEFERWSSTTWSTGVSEVENTKIAAKNPIKRRLTRKR